ncbi:hypothetical protein PAQ31011_03342 [Pandoraea aquatica]|uniref:Uncharacterized protein n=1 Tax=Pandoraea aquatica TaxID=2508290 RepID=A0A5E4WLX3_9BURK|nr:hypothetical protein PAQ31011_03342 [Pandoraea aquatica]
MCSAAAVAGAALQNGEAVTHADEATRHAGQRRANNSGRGKAERRRNAGANDSYPRKAISL